MNPYGQEDWRIDCLLQAARQDNAADVVRVISNGLAPDEWISTEGAALHVAAAMGNSRVCRALLRHKVRDACRHHESICLQKSFSLRIPVAS